MTTAAITDTHSVSDSREPLLVLSRGPRHREWLVFGICIGVLVPVLIETMAWLFPKFYSSLEAMPPLFEGMIRGILLYPLIFLFVRLQGRMAIRGILATQRAWRKEPTTEVIPILVEKVPQIFGNMRTLKQLGTTLRELGFKSRPVIMHWILPPPPSQPPLTVPFEPIPLDEANHAFHALEEGDSELRNAMDPSARRLTRDELTIRRLRKTYLYSSGWVAMIVFGSLLIITGVVSLLSRKFEPMLIFFAFMLLMASLPLLLGGAIGPAWLLVPGGLVLRKARKRKMATDVHLFRPAETSLLIRPLNKRLWQMIVSDEIEFGIAKISDRELTMLLRAWRSPLPPPSPEKLVDLT